jgi:tyrosyl-tRNA synthetase
VTALVHGSEAAVSADAASAVLFGADPTDAPAAVLEVVAGEVPTAEVSDLDRGGPSLVTALQASGLVSSTSEARRALAQGGVYLNGQRADADRPLTPGDFLHGRYALLRRGKRSFAMALAPGSSAEPGS